MFLDLPGDVLHAILCTCSTPSLNALILTSSQCKDLATAHFLRSVRLDRNPAQINSYLNYILSNTQFYDDGGSGDRKQLIGAGTYVRSLEILHQAFKPEPNGQTVPISTWAPLLTRALARMPNLRAIAIKCKVDDIVDSSPEFPSTLLDMPQLRALDLGSLTSQASGQFGEAMNRMRLKHGDICLQRVVLLFYDYSSSDIFADTKGIGDILFCSRESLKEIGLRYCNLNGLLRGVQTGDRDNPHRAVTVFPSVTDISLVCCFVSGHTLSHSFPNVHTLTIAQVEFTDDACPASCPILLFPKLSNLQGSRTDLTRFVEMHGSCDLRRIVIQTVWLCDTDDIWDNKVFSLLAFLPLRSLHFSLSNAGSFSWWRRLTNSLPHLTFLSFDSLVTTEIGAELFCIKLPRLLSSLSLEYIAITLSFASYRWWGPLHQYILYILGRDKTVALAYARNIPTLKYFEIFRNQKGSRRTWWRVVREKPGAAEKNRVGESLEVTEIEYGENVRDIFDWNWRS